MHKSERFLYELRPDWDRADKQERKQLRKNNRSRTKIDLQEHKRRGVRNDVA